MSIKALAAIALAAIPVASTAAAQSPEPIYTTHMYSDATHTEEVGTITGACRYRFDIGYYVQYAQTGTYTYEQVDELVGYCPDTPL